jgi:hypothetical protein
MDYLIKVTYQLNKWLNNYVTKVTNYLLTQPEVWTLITENAAIGSDLDSVQSGPHYENIVACIIFTSGQFQY